MSTPDDPYAAPGGEPPKPEQPGQPAPPAQPGQPTQPPYGQPPAQNPGYAPGYGPQPGYGSTQPGQPPYGAPPQPGQPGYGQPGQPYGYPPSTRTNGMAIAALVCSLAAFVVCISAPVGIVLGFVALSQIKRTGEQGRGLALAGIWVGAAFTALVVIGLAVLVAFGIWAADEVDQACDRSDYSTEQAYQDCIERQLEERFSSDSGDFTTTSFQVR